MTHGTVLRAKEVIATCGELPLVEMMAIGLFVRLGWRTANLYHETFGQDGTEGRLSNSEVVLVRRLRVALVRLNLACRPTLTAKPPMR